MTDFLKIFSNTPGIKKAANGGVLIPIENGGLLHITSINRLPDNLKSWEAFYLPFCSVNEIIRMRSLRSSQDYLLRLRANAIADSPRAIRVFNTRKSIFQNTKRQWSLTYYYHKFDGNHKEYINLLSAPHQKKLKKVASGMAFIPDANAICIRSLAGDVVLTSESLEQFYRYMNIGIYGQQLQIPLKDRIYSLILAARIMNGNEALDFDIDPRALFSTGVERKLYKNVRDQLQFTFGHEYAHYLRDHISSPYISTKESFNTYRHDLEFEADIYAIKHVTSPVDQKRIASAGITVLIFLHFLDQLNFRLGFKNNTVFSTHPPTIDRIWSFWQSFNGLISISHSEMQATLNNINSTITTIESATQKIKGDIFEFYGSIYLPSFRPKPKLDRIDF